VQRHSWRETDHLVGWHLSETRCSFTSWPSASDRLGLRDFATTPDNGRGAGELLMAVQPARGFLMSISSLSPSPPFPSAPLSLVSPWSRCLVAAARSLVGLWCRTSANQPEVPAVGRCFPTSPRVTTAFPSSKPHSFVPAARPSLVDFPVIVVLLLLQPSFLCLFLIRRTIVCGRRHTCFVFWI
jgi:hypothetical protein